MSTTVTQTQHNIEEDTAEAEPEVGGFMAPDIMLPADLHIKEAIGAHCSCPLLPCRNADKHHPPSELSYEHAVMGRRSRWHGGIDGAKGH